jgi:hypothetical protein
VDRLAELYPDAESNRYRVLTDPDYRSPAMRRRFDFLKCLCGHHWAEVRT